MIALPMNKRSVEVVHSQEGTMLSGMRLLSKLQISKSSKGQWIICIMQNHRTIGSIILPFRNLPQFLASLSSKGLPVILFPGVRLK